MYRAFAASGLAAVLLSIATPALAQAPPAWVYATPGTRIVLGTNGQDSDIMMVCNSPDAMRAMAQNACSGRKEGTPVVIEAVVPAPGKKCSDPKTVLRIHASDGTWHGFVDMDSVYPLVPAGTTLTLKSPNAGQPLTLATNRQTGDDQGTRLEDSVTVKVIAFSPGYEVRNLHAVVLSGAHAGKQGWIDAFMGFAGKTAAFTLLCPEAAH
jgi:hypothetical protein